jgi:hypothetical protein
VLDCGLLIPTQTHHPEFLSLAIISSTHWPILNKPVQCLQCAAWTSTHICIFSVLFLLGLAAQLEVQSKRRLFNHARFEAFFVVINQQIG